MDISIRFEAVEPPEGRVHREGHRDWLPFVGWLELISAIERFMETARRPLPRELLQATDKHEEEEDA
jgi:hypothetical protein